MIFNVTGNLIPVIIIWRCWITRQSPVFIWYTSSPYFTPQVCFWKSGPKSERCKKLCSYKN